MNETFLHWGKLAGLLTEQEDPRGSKKDLYVFDFDDTLGVTTSPTLVAAVEYNGGDPDDFASYIPIKDLKSRVGGTIKGLKTPEQSDVDSSGLSGNFVRSDDELDSAEAIVLDTEQYRDWKEKYIPGGNHTRLVINPNISDDIRNAGRNMFTRGESGEIHIADFSPSSTIGNSVKPIEKVLDILASANAEGHETAVVTARKGETDLDSLGGGKVPATNAADIADFITDEIGSPPDIVIGAADYNPTDPASAKKDLVVSLFEPHDNDNIHFYDDDPENARKVSQICNIDEDEGMDGTELDIYNYEFSKGGGGAPTFSCTVGDKDAMIKIDETNLRKIIRRVIEESLEKRSLYYTRRRK